MKKTDVSFPAFTVSTVSIPGLQPVRRLIVLVPESEIDIAISARRIRELACAFGGRVLFLGLSRDATHEPGLRRQLVTLSTIVAGENVFVESKIEIGNDWLAAVKSEWNQGDIVACFSAQYSGFARKPLSQILESNLNSTVYILTGAYQQEKRLNSKWISNAAAWVGSIALILGFLWLQIKIVQFPHDWTHTLLLYISLFAEVGMVWMWNSLTS